MEDMSKMESAVLELLRLCQDEEWNRAASMHGRMVPVAAKLAESEPRMASSIYGNLGFALESLAEEVENPADGLTLWMEAITMHQSARSIACRSDPCALLAFALCPRRARKQLISVMLLCAALGTCAQKATLAVTLA